MRSARRDFHFIREISNLTRHKTLHSIVNSISVRAGARWCIVSFPARSRGGV